jgi:ketosteroid isomerase-like protein
VSEENVEAVRRVYERWGRGDFSGSVELFEPDVVFVIGSGFPDSGSYRGLDEIATYMRGFLEPWDRITIAAEELADAGDAVIATVLQSGVGIGSGVPTEFRYIQEWTFRDRRVVRLENSRERPPTA